MDDKTFNTMKKYKSLSIPERRRVRSGFSKEQKVVLNEMNKKYDSIMADQRKAAQRTPPRGGGGGGGTPTQYGASGKRGAEKMRKNPFDLNKGGKVKFSRGGGVATQGTKFSKDG